MFAAAADTNSQLVAESPVCSSVSSTVAGSRLSLNFDEVAWQLCDPDAAQPELSRARGTERVDVGRRHCMAGSLSQVAESGREAMDKQMFIANVWGPAS